MSVFPEKKHLVLVISGSHSPSASEGLLHLPHKSRSEEIRRKNGEQERERQKYQQEKNGQTVVNHVGKRTNESGE